MGKQKKKRRQMYSAEEYHSAKADLKQQWKSFNKKLALTMLLLFLGLCGLYYLLLSFHLFWVTPVFYGAAAVLFLLFFFVNRGFSKNPITEDQLPEDWSPERKRKFAEDDIVRKAFARRLMVVLVPLLLLVGIDIFILLLLPQILR